jgi:bifunctional non-homologous end joining protein LigD
MQFATARSPFDDRAWAFEIKYDGVRVLARTGPGARLKGPGDADATRWFEEIARSLERLPDNCIVDGEVVAFDEDGRNSTRAVQCRMHSRGEPGGFQPVAYRVFDLLIERGHDIRTTPYLARKEALIHLLHQPLPSLVYVEHVIGEGRWLFEQVVSRQLVGIAAKRIDSPYRSGRRSRDWLAIRPGAARRLPTVSP